MAKQAKTNAWLLSWDQTGLEAVIDVDSYESRQLDSDKQLVWDTLNSDDPANIKQGRTAAQELSSILQQLTFRARFNPQRHYEIYSIGMPQGVSKEDIVEMFEGDGAQMMVDLIREKGVKYYSDREPNKRKLIS